MTEYDLGPFLRLEAGIDLHEDGAVRERWDFGQLLLEKRGDKKKLPKDLLADLVEATKQSRRELQYRLQFAERVADEDQLCKVLHDHKSWWAIISEFLPEKRRSSDPPPPPAGLFSTVVIDPPWPMEKIEREVRPDQGAALDYSVMDEDELVELPVPAAEHAHLYVWTTQSFLPMALRLVEAWDFNYQCLLTWVKNVGMTPYSWMYSTEHVVFARRGSLDLLVQGRRLDFAAKTQGHSRKPSEFYALVREVSPQPRIDMFARSTHEGFTAWGDEAGLLDAA